MEKDEQRALSFDADVVDVLRHVGHTAGSRPASVENLECAFAQPLPQPVPAVKFHANQSLRFVVERAGELAADDSSASISRRHLAEALAEAHVRAAGLDLEGLRRTRTRLRGLYGVSLSQRTS